MKNQALKSRQSPLQKAMSFGENALKIAGSIKGAYEFGRQAYDFAQYIAPIASSLL